MIHDAAKITHSVNNTAAEIHACGLAPNMMKAKRSIRHGRECSGARCRLPPQFSPRAAVAIASR